MTLTEWLKAFFGKNPAQNMQPEQAARVKRIDRYATAWDAYYGKYPDALPVKPGKPNDNVSVNFARLVVDQSADFLFGKDIDFEIDELSNTRAEEWLKECWNANHKMTLLQKLAINGGVCGQVFVKIADGGAYPRLILLDPGIVDVETEPGDYETARSFTITYPHGDTAHRQVIRRSDGGIWQITDQEKREQDKGWLTISDVEWQKPWPPVLYCQNLPAPNEFWGLADIEEDFLRLNRSTNFVLSNIARILRYHAHPKTWATGVLGPDNLRIGADETILLPLDAQMHNLEMQGDLSSSIEFYKRLREALHETARSPEIASGRMDNVGQLSGAALQILYTPLTSKTNAKRRLYGEMLNDLNARLLELGGFGAANVTVIHWPEILPHDQMQERQSMLIDKQLGVSTDTILEKLGYNAALETEKAADEATNLGDALLAKFEQGKP